MSGTKGGNGSAERDDRNTCWLRMYEDLLGVPIGRSGGVFGGVGSAVVGEGEADLERACVSDSLKEDGGSKLLGRVGGAGVVGRGEVAVHDRRELLHDCRCQLVKGLCQTETVQKLSAPDPTRNDTHRASLPFDSTHSFIRLAE